jgi:hypothetical protein
MGEENRLRAFFASPYAAPFRWIRDAVAAACREHSVELRSVDEVVRPGADIITTMHAEIDAADFAFAVLTGLNPNVFYELGRLLQASKPTIMLIDKRHVHELPFDVRTFAVLPYWGDESAALELRRSVGDAIGKLRLALDPRTRSEHIAPETTYVIEKSTVRAGVDFENLRRVAQTMMGKSDCQTAEIKTFDTETFKGWHQSIECPCGDTILVVIDLNGEIKRVKKA